MHYTHELKQHSSRTWAAQRLYKHVYLNHSMLDGYIPRAVWFSGEPWAEAACALIFVAAAITDFLDGYLARTMVLPPTPPIPEA